MNKKEKLISILDNLKAGFDLSVYNFVDNTAIIKDIRLNKMFFCDVLFNENKPFFINIAEKETNILTINDIKN